MPDLPAPGEVDDSGLTALSEYRYWKPEAQERALELIQQRQERPWSAFYCRKPKCDGLPHDDWTWNHARWDQHPPKWHADWLTWLIRSGRGAGKTRTGSEVSHRATNIYGVLRFVAPTGPDFRDTMVEDPESGILVTSPPGKRPEWEPSKKKLTWPNGAVGLGFSAEEPDRLRGKQCLVAGTMIETYLGPRPIETICEGDWVWTRKGLREVIDSGSKMDAVMTLDHPAGHLMGTLDHPVWTENRGWVRMDSVEPGDSLMLWSGRSIGQGAPIVTATAPTTSAPDGFTNGKSVRFHPDTRSITGTATALTTDPRTSSHSRPRSTESSTRTSLSRTPAPVAVGSSSSSGDAPASGALTANEQSPESSSARPRSADTGPSSDASSAGRSSAPAAAPSVAPPASTGTERVYDLTVAGEHEFFANGILVHNSGYAWLDEPAHYPDPDAVWKNLLFGHRIAGKNNAQPKILCTSTPKPIQWLKDLVKDPLTVTTQVSSYANIANLAESYRKNVLDPHKGTRVGRQELEGEILEDVEGALWNWDLFIWHKEAPALRRIVVAIDPAGSIKKRADDTGIIVLGIGHDNVIYVLHDATGKYSPSGWADKAVALYEFYRADAIVAEKNYGGDMVRNTLENSRLAKAILPRIILVESRRGKDIRAEPVVALYEKKRVVHVGPEGTLVKLEDEQTAWVPGEGASPNRLDALVHGVTELAGGSAPSEMSSPTDLISDYQAPHTNPVSSVVTGPSGFWVPPTYGIGMNQPLPRPGVFTQ